MSVSNYFSQNQLKGLLKVGDIIVPATNRLPSFSQSGCVEHIDRMLAYLSSDDLSGLRMVFSALRWSPRWSIHLLLKACKYNQWFPGPIGAGLRMLEIGIKGAIVSPYYADLTSKTYTGPKVFDVIGWDAKVHEADDQEISEPKSVPYSS